MLAKRIIACLDVNSTGVVKGVRFENLKKAGDPIALARKYCKEGADELVFLDIGATIESRNTFYGVVRDVSKELFIPLTVGGGIRTLADFSKALGSGADKVAINSAAISNPKLITDAAREFGSQCVVVAIDAKRAGLGKWGVFSQAGSRDEKLDAVQWAKTAESLGAGEILLTSMDQDGSKKGFDLELTKRVSEAAGIPVIASGGAGQAKDFEGVFIKGKADAALGAGIFHFNEVKIKSVKQYLDENGICVRR